MDCTSLLNAMRYPSIYRDSSQLCYTFGLIVEYKSNTAKPEEIHDFRFSTQTGTDLFNEVWPERFL